MGFTILVIHSMLPLLLADAYRLGDAVGILLRTHTPSRGGSTIEAYRHQLPRFGVSTRTRFDISSLIRPDDLRLATATGDATASGSHKSRRQFRDELGTPRERLRLSLSFDEGFHHIPWLDVYDPSRSGGRALENLIVTIVYSGGDGSIHAVHRESRYRDIPVGGVRGDNDAAESARGIPKSFTVDYIWVNEADVDVQWGLLAMFLAVLIVSLSGMVGACTSSSKEDATAGKGRRYKEKHIYSASYSGVGVGTSEGFAKRL